MFKENKILLKKGSSSKLLAENLVQVQPSSETEFKFLKTVLRHQANLRLLVQKRISRGNKLSKKMRNKFC